MNRESDKAISVLTDAINSLKKREEGLLADIKEKESRIEELRSNFAELQTDFENACLKFQETEAANAQLQAIIDQKTGK